MAIIASDSARAYETAKLIFPTAQIDSEILLRETDCGELTGLSPKQAVERFGEQYLNRHDPFDLRLFGGEHVGEMEARVKKFMEKVKASYSNSRVAIVTHGGPLKALIAVALNTDFISICDHITFNNCGVSGLQLWNRTGSFNI